jgi:hypothetical protein
MWKVNQFDCGMRIVVSGPRGPDLSPSCKLSEQEADLEACWLEVALGDCGLEDQKI